MASIKVAVHITISITVFDNRRSRYYGCPSAHPEARYGRLVPNTAMVFLKVKGILYRNPQNDPERGLWKG